MKRYLDDLRPCPEGFILAPKALSLPGTFINVSKWIADHVVAGKIKMPEYMAHSMNPVGKKNIIDCMESIKRRMNGF